MLMGLDLETAPMPGYPQVYALQPFRARQGKARVTLCATATSHHGARTTPGDVESLRELLEGSRQVYATYNGLFDVAWLLSLGLGDVVRRHQWVDVMLLWKLHSNSQRNELMPAWSLLDAAKKWLADWPHLERFIWLKNTEVAAGEQDEYWHERGKLDALATVLIAERITRVLTSQQRRHAAITAQCIIPVAQSWVNGVLVDSAKAESMAPVITQEMMELEFKLKLNNPYRPWEPSKILRSPKQLAEVLYDHWKLPLEHYTEKGARASNKTALTYLADHDDRALDILRWRELNTQYTKFILGLLETTEYLNSDVIHASPKLFSTYTGRMTYATRTGKKGEAYKAKCGVPLHQWPRPAALRNLIKAPEGFLIGELDAAGQEARFMCEFSQDQNMLRIFNSAPPNDDIHSNTGAQLGGYTFEEFMHLKAAGDEAIVGDHGLRNLGKFYTLSGQYRVGARKQRIVARMQYGLRMSFEDVKQGAKTYHRSYPGIRKYWGDAIRRARTLGYAETLGGRRFKLDFWGEDDKWGAESSAINMPIQGTGADQKELAIAVLSKKLPELSFMLDLHDGLFYLLPNDRHAIPLMLEARDILDNMDYEKHWDVKPSIPLTWDASLGPTWGAMKEL